jgi:hypothetical protein
MTETLERARSLIGALRFAGEVVEAPPALDDRALAHARDTIAANAVALTPSLFPELYGVLARSCGALGIEPGCVSGYVYAAADIQAACFPAGEGVCIARFSSGLINLMSDAELAFVMGHELGHFLLAHRGVHGGPASVESDLRNRAREISADRAGLLACRSLEVAARAIMKTAAGVGDAHLRFDVGAFLAQIRDVSGTVDTASTHPSLLMRCRALLWFSLSREYRAASEQPPTGQPLAAIDERIAKDLARYADGPAQALIASARDEVRTWMLVAAAVRNGTLVKSEQALLRAWLGEATTAKLLGLLRDQTREEAAEHTWRALRSAVASYTNAAPKAAESEIPDLMRRVADALGDPGVVTYLARTLRFEHAPSRTET